MPVGVVPCAGTIPIMERLLLEKDSRVNMLLMFVILLILLTVLGEISTEEEKYS